MLLDMQSLLTNQGEALEFVLSSTFLGSCIVLFHNVTDKVSERICKIRIAFTNSRHLWPQSGISLNIKGRVHQATVRAVLLNGSAELRRLQVFDNRCLRTVARVGWCRRIRNGAIRSRVLDCATATSNEECVQHQKLRWLKRVLRVPNHRSPKRVMFLCKFRVADYETFGCCRCYSHSKTGTARSPNAPVWRGCKLWLLVDISSVHVISFYTDYLNECLEVFVLTIFLAHHNYVDDVVRTSKQTGGKTFEQL
ncbi:hypothetical protein CSKR_100734 [Clonorchis sinensis]|uniref:Uncharacterized protein n=1 Tax=Clonorchis sinensis TaxID=79923 RepID=A0A419PKW0_CLOSI|nr:hypothetical protein CSKR_100734 [Clonorchis sinensis]